MKLPDILKTYGKSFSMKFLEVNNFLRNYLQYFAKEVEQNFIEEFSCEQQHKKFNTISETKFNTFPLKYTTLPSLQ